jgi:hypothetical protein
MMNVYRIVSDMSFQYVSFSINFIGGECYFSSNVISNIHLIYNAYDELRK